MSAFEVAEGVLFFSAATCTDQERVLETGSCGPCPECWGQMALGSVSVHKCLQSVGVLCSVCNRKGLSVPNHPLAHNISVIQL